MPANVSVVIHRDCGVCPCTEENRLTDAAVLRSHGMQTSMETLGWGGSRSHLREVVKQLWRSIGVRECRQVRVALEGVLQIACPQIIAAAWQMKA